MADVVEGLVEQHAQLLRQDADKRLVVLVVHQAVREHSDGEIT